MKTGFKLTVLFSKKVFVRIDCAVDFIIVSYTITIELSVKIMSRK